MPFIPLGGSFRGEENAKSFTIMCVVAKNAIDVTTYCKSCLVYAKNKDSAKPLPGVLYPLPVPPEHFHSWSLDSVTNLPVVNKCNTILMVVDRFTKYLHVIPCWMGEDTLSAATVA